MKNNLSNEFLERVFKTKFPNGFKNLIKNSSFLTKLPNELLYNLLTLSDYEFNMYLAFLSKFVRNKKDFVGYEEKLIHISNILIASFSNPNLGELVNLLTETNLIDNYAVIEFSSMFLKIHDYEKVSAIADILYSFSLTLKKEDLFKIMNLAKSINDSEILFQVVHLFGKESIINDKNFNAYFTLISKNVNNPNLLFFIRLLYIRNVRDLKDSPNLLNKYILNNKSKFNKNELLLKVFKDISLLESYRLEEILQVITTCDEKRYNLINKLLDNKNRMSNNVFYILFKELKMVDLNESDFIFALLNNKRIAYNETQLKFALNYMHKTKDEKKLIAFYNLFVIGKLKDENLYSDYAVLMQNALLKTINKEQRETLNELALILINAKYKIGIINEILNTRNKFALKNYKKILNISYVRDNVRIIEIIKRLNNLKDDMQMAVIMKLVSDISIFKSNNFFKMLDMVLNSKIKYLFVIDYIDRFTKSPLYSNLILDNNRDNVLKLFDIVLEMKDSNQYEFIKELFNYPNIFIDSNQLGVIRMFLLQIKEKYKYDALLKYISKKYSKKFNLIDNNNRIVINLIKLCKHSYQTDLLLSICELTNNEKVLGKVLNVKSPSRTMYLYRLLKNKEILNNSNIEEIIDTFLEAKSAIQLEGMLTIAISKRFKDNEILKYFTIIKNTKNKEQVEVLIDILKKYPGEYNENLLRFCEKIPEIKSEYCLILADEVIKNSKNIPSDVVERTINKIINCQDNLYFTEDTRLKELIFYVKDLLLGYTGQGNDAIENLIAKIDVNKGRK